MYRERNEGKENELTDERIQLLNELGESVKIKQTFLLHIEHVLMLLFI